MNLLIAICSLLCIAHSASFEVRGRVISTTIQLNASKGSIFSSGQGFDKSSNRKHMRLDNDDSIEQLEQSLKNRKPVHKLRYDTYHNKKLEPEDIPRKYGIDANYKKKTVIHTNSIMKLEMDVNPSKVKNQFTRRNKSNNDIDPENMKNELMQSRSYGLSNYVKPEVKNVRSDSSHSNSIASAVGISNAVVGTKSISVESSKPTRSYGLSNYVKPEVKNVRSDSSHSNSIASAVGISNAVVGTKSIPVVQQVLELYKQRKLQEANMRQSEIESRHFSSLSHKAQQSRDKNVVLVALKFIVAKVRMLIALTNIKFIFSKKNYANFLLQ